MYHTIYRLNLSYVRNLDVKLRKILNIEYIILYSFQYNIDLELNFPLFCMIFKILYYEIIFIHLLILNL
jgi:hypothetical protein